MDDDVDDDAVDRSLLDVDAELLLPARELVSDATEDELFCCIVERTDAGTGGMTGRASCASSELTTPRLGARMLGTLRLDMDTLDDGCCCCCWFCCWFCCCEPAGLFVADVMEFCSNCFSSTFCESSALAIGCADVCCGGGASGGVDDSDAIEASAEPASVASDVDVDVDVDTSKLCRFIEPSVEPLPVAAVCCCTFGTSSIDLDRRNAAAAAAAAATAAAEFDDSGDVSCECSNVLVLPDAADDLDK